MDLENSVALLVTSINNYIVSAQTTNEKTQESIQSLANTIEKFATAAELRMKILETNMDSLIKLIKTEHTNGS